MTKQPHMIMRVITILVLLAMTGCAGYQLGATLPPGVNSVYIPVFRNESGENHSWRKKSLVRLLLSFRKTAACAWFLKARPTRASTS